ncbi:LuxR family transcriptional regulator [Mycolicibacterium setense]|uniref:LuxR family transcriptional regulator n=1 Tax=Mycolicibacterium setense TaxID=431269 RepID=A0ABR4YQ19_9MYCO|nr:LuxR family transcriptional regulator [Mycolicibacterium setense]KHO21039.1 LuxR family transcriptional regulator [Mycolicibacterium setense]
MSSQGQGQRLRGRADECTVLRGLISTARAGSSQVLVLRGEAGVGKTELLHYAVEQASGIRCVQVAGVQSDMELAFAGLQQLCAPLMAHVDELPDPQREALVVAFGRGVGPTPDRFLVGLAVLSLFAAAAHDQPLLCVIDDAQWLDQVSVQTLAFVARRLLAEPIAVLFAARDDGAQELVGLPHLSISGLSADDARDLLESVMVGGIDPLVRDRIVAETRGIPLALLDVPRNVTAAELSGGFWIAGKRGSAAATEAGFILRIQDLPPLTRQLLLLAAAEPVGDPSLFVRAAEQLSIPIDALGPAEAAGLIEFGPRMRFHHPLMRSAAYRAADLTDRRAIHRALAAATDPQSDPDRRAWHAANAAGGPDDVVAAELETSAARAQSRGGIAAAAAFLERAAVLTADPALRGARALAAAEAKLVAAAPASAGELLAIAELAPLSDLQRAKAIRLSAQIEFARRRGGAGGGRLLSGAAAQLFEAAQRLEGLDDDLARETYLEALVASMYAGRLGDGLLATVADAACRAVDRVADLKRPIDLLLSGLASRLSGSITTGADQLRSALELMCDQAKSNDEQALQWMSLGLTIVQDAAAIDVWDDGLWQRLATALVRQARDAGALAVLPPALAFRAGAHVFAGEFMTAATLFDEANLIAAATGDAPLRYHVLSLAAWRGNDDAIGKLKAVAAAAADRGEGRALDAAGGLSAVLYNALGRYEEAFTAVRGACEFENLGFHGWCLLELTEAAVRVGERDAASLAAHRVVERGLVSTADLARGFVAYARALIAEDDRAEDFYREAIEYLGRTSFGVYRARAGLLYGEWLRRMNRRIDARRQLGEAHEMFTRMGAQAFAERARRELVATGEKVRKQPASSGDALTGQETQIARLAGEGLTNQEIGAQLFISTHTVEWHLRKVFVKLGITSRRQLRTISWAS